MDYAIFYALKEELERAEKIHRDATENFWKVSAQPRSLPRYGAGAPHPDNNQALNAAVSRESHARQKHIEALMQLNEYLLHGTVPEHLRKPAADETRKSGDGTKSA